MMYYDMISAQDMVWFRLIIAPTPDYSDLRTKQTWNYLTLWFFFSAKLTHMFEDWEIAEERQGILVRDGAANITLRTRLGEYCI